MEWLVVGLVVVVALPVGIALQAGLLILATNFAADETATFPQAVGIVIGASVATLLIRLTMEMVATGGSMIFSLPMSLTVWTGAISWVCEIRLAQAFFSAVLMTVFQCLVGVAMFAVFGSMIMAAMQTTGQL